MYRHFPTLLERPETSTCLGAVAYDVLAFFSLPFLLLIFSQGFTGIKAAATVELIYHVINFIMAIIMFREYLADSLYDLKVDFKGLMKTVSTSAALIVLIAIVLNTIFGMSEGLGSLSAYGTLPLAEMELFTLSCNVVIVYPVLGTLCMVLLAPVTITCLYYCAVFAPVCYTRPILCYLAMTVFLAFPRYCNAATFWVPQEEMILYITQLPLHIIACRAYQKSDSVWAPILTIGLVNLISCVLLIGAGLLNSLT